MGMLCHNRCRACACTKKLAAEVCKINSEFAKHSLADRMSKLHHRTHSRVASLTHCEHQALFVFHALVSVQNSVLELEASLLEHCIGCTPCRQLMRRQSYVPSWPRWKTSFVLDGSRNCKLRSLPLMRGLPTQTHNRYAPIAHTKRDASAYSALLSPRALHMYRSHGKFCSLVYQRACSDARQELSVSFSCALTT
jgi:hypothetical protein